MDTLNEILQHRDGGEAPEEIPADMEAHFMADVQEGPTVESVFDIEQEGSLEPEEITEAIGYET